MFIVMQRYDNRGRVETTVFEDTAAPKGFSNRYADVYYDAFDTLSKARQFERECKNA